MLPAIHGARAIGVAPVTAAAARGHETLPVYAGQRQAKDPEVRPSATVHEDILQGKVLTGRRPLQYQSTHAYLDERRFETARSAAVSMPGVQPRRAAGLYQRSLQPQPGPERPGTIDVTV